MKKNKPVKDITSDSSTWSYFDEIIPLEEISNASAENEHNSGSNIFLLSQELKNDFNLNSINIKHDSTTLQDSNEMKSNHVSEMTEPAASEVLIATESCSVLDTPQTYITSSPIYFDYQENPAEIKNDSPISSDNFWGFSENILSENVAGNVDDETFKDNLTEDKKMHSQKGEDMHASIAASVVGNVDDETFQDYLTENKKMHSQREEDMHASIAAPVVGNVDDETFQDYLTEDKKMHSQKEEDMHASAAATVVGNIDDETFQDYLTEDKKMHSQKEEDSSTAGPVAGFRRLKLHSFTEQKIISTDCENLLHCTTKNEVNITWTAKDVQNITPVESLNVVERGDDSFLTKNDNEANTAISSTMAGGLENKQKNYRPESNSDSVKEKVIERFSEREKCNRLESYNPLSDVEKSLNAGTFFKSSKTGKDTPEESTKQQNNDFETIYYLSGEENTSFYLDTASEFGSEGFCLTEGDIEMDLPNIEERCQCSVCKNIFAQKFALNKEGADIYSDEEITSSQSDTESDEDLMQNEHKLVEEITSNQSHREFEDSLQNKNQLVNPSDDEITSSQFDKTSEAENKNLSSPEVRIKRKILKRFRRKPQCFKRTNKNILKSVFTPLKLSKKRFKRGKMFSGDGTRAKITKNESSPSSSELASGNKNCKPSSLTEKSSCNLSQVNMDEVLNALLLMPSYLEKLESANLIPVYDVKIEESRLHHRIIRNEEWVVREEIFDASIFNNDENYFGDNEATLNLNERNDELVTGNFETNSVDERRLQQGDTE